MVARFVDYFAVVGGNINNLELINPPTPQLSKNNYHKKGHRPNEHTPSSLDDLSYSSVNGLPNGFKGPSDEDTETSTGPGFTSISQLQFKPIILNRFPLKDYKDSSLSNEIPMVS